MGNVQTVTGILPAEQLGHCQMHEHLYVSEGPATQKFPSLLIDEPERSSCELYAYRRAGGGSIVDAQPGGAGRDVARLKEISIASGVPIVAVTGYHLPHFYPEGHWLLTENREEMEARFSAELSGGCAEAPDVRPGAVKAALSAAGCTDAEKERFLAAAGAAAKAGVPLIVHTEKGFDAVRAAEFAQTEGIPAHRILICHADRQAEDFSVHDAIADTGVMLEYDTIGRFKYHDDEAEVRLIRHMLERGHGAQLLLSLDTTRERLFSYGGAIGLTYLFDVFLPALMRAGVPEEIVRRIMMDNPRRVFE